MSHYQPDPTKSVTLTIDGISVTVPEGTSILEAAKQIGINIPILCHHPDLRVRANCRICIVTAKGQRKFKTACSTEVWSGAEILTNSTAIRDARKTVLELILAEHPQECLQCIRNGSCELQKLAKDFGIQEIPFTPSPLVGELPIDDAHPAIVRNPNKCVKCGRCVEVCQEIQTVRAINTAHRSQHYEISTAFEKNLAETPCVSCGQCVAVCPVGALYEHDDTAKVWAALDNHDLHVVVQTAPAVRVALGEEFGMDSGNIFTGKMVAGLRRLGFAKVFDTDFSADVTIMEEGHELLERINNNGPLPLITSCCPGWVNFAEKLYPELLPHVSSCKSPQQMFGALAKTYYAQTSGISPEKIFVVSIMPCTAKKYECARPEMNDSGYQDVDVVLTTRELAKMLKQANINFNSLPEESFDEPLGISTGAAVIFGTSGGVMEAALRTVYEVVTEKPLGKLDFDNVRGLTGIKEATVDLDGTTVKVAIANGLGNARILLEKIKSGQADYQFVEIMACPGGCIGGGGQPHGTTTVTKQGRMSAMYQADKNSALRQSHKNPAIISLYKDFLAQPLGHKSHKLLHTQYKTIK
ncbi:MAG: hydrogenase, Fe-only [Firmicutes bacterium]|nr:hydrogenase, Fe-only [Bacillota bacterium]